MPSPLRNRIKAHRRVRAGDLVPHEWNYRLHPGLQKAALQALYREVGFARSLLAYELPDGRLKLIDGHLRRNLDPVMEVEVEVLDVNDEEARAFLLSIDPLTALVETQTQLHQRLLELTPAISPDQRDGLFRKAKSPSRLCKLSLPPGQRRGTDLRPAHRANCRGARPGAV